MRVVLRGTSSSRQAVACCKDTLPQMYMSEKEGMRWALTNELQPACWPPERGVVRLCTPGR